jgi:hypothetical protein
MREERQLRLNDGLTDRLTPASFTVVPTGIAGGLLSRRENGKGYDFERAVIGACRVSL